jgi:hypothetical protein
MPRIATVLVFTLGLVVSGYLSARADATAEIGDFLRSLYATHEVELRNHFEQDWRVAVAHGLPDTPTNRERFLRVRFVYQLVRHGGLLGNNFLIREDDGRHPDTMLRDAFSESPGYQLSYSSGWEGNARRVRGGDVFTFGRCDEFEMEQSAILRRVFDIQARIAMLTSNHVVTEVPMEGGFLRLDASYLRCYAFDRTPIVDAPPEDGVYSVARTNRLAERDFHPHRPVAVAGAARVRAAVAAFLQRADAHQAYCK